MSNVLEYKGYLARIEYSAEDRILFGRIEGIKDLVNFESDSVATIEQEFHAAVDDYLQMCEELGEAPDKAYSGTFNVRIKPALHRELAMRAIKDGETLNATVERAVSEYINPTAEPYVAPTMYLQAVMCTTDASASVTDSALESIHRRKNKEGIMYA